MNAAHLRQIVDLAKVDFSGVPCGPYSRSSADVGRPEGSGLEAGDEAVPQIAQERRVKVRAEGKLRAERVEDTG